MSYIALYRKFRPLKFSDILGQEHICQILKNQIINDRIGHAYLFSGTRGTGKTTTAKIFARAVNCLHPINGEPCNECEMCKSILKESMTDVTEIDAASNNGVDNIRDIRDEVMYLPTKAKYRVYIIDEVHMLSSGAFNALLKTLEEPPKHVKFILATTEPNKLPATILSRCQRFDFKRISNENIVKQLKQILETMNKSAEDEALEIIAQLAEGAMRDAISILERCVSDVEHITVEYISELVGLPDEMKILEVINNIVENNSSEMVENVNNILNDGKNISLVLNECIKNLQNILIYISTGNVAVYNEKEKEKIVELSKKVSADKAANLIVAFSEIINAIKWSDNPNIVAKAMMIKACISTEYDGLEDLKKRIEKLESGKIIVAKQEESVEKKTEVKAEIKQKEEAAKSIEENVVEEKKEEIVESSNFAVTEVEHWKEVLDDLRANGKVNLFANLINAKAKLIAEKTIGIYFKVDFAKGMVEKGDNLKILTEYVAKVLGTEYAIRCFKEGEKANLSKLSEVENTAKQFNIPIDIVDE